MSLKTYNYPMDVDEPKSAHTAQTIYLYLLLSAKPESDFTVNAYFTGNVQYAFHRLGSIVDGTIHGNEIYIYRAKLKLVFTTGNGLYHPHRNQSRTDRTFVWGLSSKNSGSEQTPAYQDDKIQCLDDSLLVEHYFIFTEKILSTDSNGPADKDLFLCEKEPKISSLFLASTIPFWNQLCIYTYALIRRKMYNVFDILFNQFQIVVEQNQQTLTAPELIDFSEICARHLEYATTYSVNQSTMIKMLIRMTGLLPITKENIYPRNDRTVKIALDFLANAKEDYKSMLGEITPQEWPLFRDGLVLYLCFELLSQPNDRINLVHSIPDEEWRKDLAIALLQRLAELEERISDQNCTDLFSLADLSRLTSEHFQLISSVQMYVKILACIIGEGNHSRVIYSQLSRQFNQIINREYLPVNLGSIIYLLKVLQNKTVETEKLSETTSNIIKDIIESSTALPKKIQHWLDSYKQDVRFPDIQLIISSIPTIRILSSLRKAKLLTTWTDTASELHSFEFFMEWFHSFLTGYTEVNEDEYREILEYWSNRCFSLPDVFLRTLARMDELIKDFQNEHYRLIFIHRMISLCFKTENVDSTIVKGLINIKSNIFLTEFVKKFEERHLTTTKNEFKQISNDQAPLMTLLGIRKEMGGSNELINVLLDLTVDKTEITNREILIYLMDSPTSESLIYEILFNEYLKHSKLQASTIKQMVQARQNCKKNPLLAMLSDLKWNSFTKDQKKILEKTWSCLGTEQTGITCNTDVLVGNTRRTDEIILKISECLESYRRNVSDKYTFVDSLAQIKADLEHNVPHSTTASQPIESILSHVSYLNLVGKLNVWNRFLAQIEQSQDTKQRSSVTKDSSLPETTTADSQSAAGLEDVHLKSDQFSRLYHEKILQIRKDSSQNSCYEILNEYVQSLGIFTESLIPICLKWKVLPISELICLFSEAHHVDADSEVLNPLLQSDDVAHLKSILDFWTERVSINKLCNGYIKLCKRYQIATQDKLIVWQNMLEINGQTSGETCVKVYRDYCAHSSNKYSESIERFISQFSLPEKLFDLLYSLDRAEIDDLLEVANNWDETLITTKTILELVILKRFFDQVDSKIKQLNDIAKPRELDEVIHCFDDLLKEDDFKDITAIIESFSKNLPIIERIHKKLENKDESKLKRILSIIADSKFRFDVLPTEGTLEIGEYQFDAYVTTADDAHVTATDYKRTVFNDLNDLRDRARLIQNASYNNKNNVQNYSEDRIEQLGVFISLVDEIQMTLAALTMLHTAGYPVMRKYITNGAKFKCSEGKYDGIHSYRSNLLTELTRWEQRLCDMYKRCIGLTYLSHQQISMIQDTIHKKMPIKSDDSTYHLLKFMGVDPTSIKSESVTDDEDPFHLLDNMVRILGDAHDTRNHQKLKHLETNTRIFVVKISERGVLRAILSLFDLEKISSPAAQQLLFCTRSTTWTEVRAFVYRCFYSQTLHQLIRPERLSTVIQDQLVQLLNALIKSSPEHFLRVGFITNISCSDLFFTDNLTEPMLIQTINNTNLLNESALDDMIRKHIGNRCTLVTSRIAGLGKSTYIQKQIGKSKKKSVKFPISGDIDIDTLMRRLRDRKIQSTPSSIAIHMDIGPITNVQQLDEFLYCLIIFRCFRFGQIPVYVPTDTQIYIELDSSLHVSNLRNEIGIFKYLRTECIERFEWTELDVTSTRTQWVANYLQAIDQEIIDKSDILEEKMTALDQRTCIDLLKKHFFSTEDSEFISWTQLSIVLSVYYKLFSDFSTCVYFMVGSLTDPTLRSELLKKLLKSANQFTSWSVETVRQNQRAMNSDNGKTMLDEHIIRYGKTESDKHIIRWDKMRRFWLIFGVDNDPLFVYKTREDIPLLLQKAFQSHYKQSGVKDVDDIVEVPRRGILKLFLSPTKEKIVKQAFPSEVEIKEKLDEQLFDPDQVTHAELFSQLISLSKKCCTPICESCFRQYPDKEQNCIECKPPNSLIVLNSLEEKKRRDFHKTMATKLEAQYILTADNYVKMLLIHLRVQSELPVLVMGETGCGKTSLIKCLCQRILNDDMEVFQIHAGVTNEKIIEKMRSYIEQANQLLNSQQVTTQKHSQEQQSKRLWIFFDELNTTPNIGLLKEIICERTLLGERLPKNMIFVGACNPLRRKTKKGETADQIAIKKYYSNIQLQIHGTRSPLLYSVVSLPETMIEHVWDYGSLDSHTEKTYIDRMLNECKDLTTEGDSWSNCLATLISESHQYFRYHDDASSVSLRDVRRFCRFYNWFYEFSDLFGGQETPVSSSLTPIVRASLLALFLCYYFRLDSYAERKDYMEQIAKPIKKFDPAIVVKSLSELLDTAKKTVLEQMDVPQGMAKNQALSDNIFVLFVCILNRIPVVLEGKPGSSKTSAVQILNSSLRGEDSEKKFLKKVPALIAISCQGSLSCTSQSIIKVFEQADKVMKAKTTLNFLPVIVFDEIGLAEISPNNPLKVLHDHLEIEKCRYGFVGLSNWRLDAAKMNRAVYLSCPEPDENDLKITASCLLEQAFSEKDQKWITFSDSVVRGLVVAYMKICEHMQKKQNKAYYFGLRDYYSLIRGIAYDWCQNKNKDPSLYQIVRHNLATNFGGIIGASEFIWSQFCEHMDQKSKIKEYSSPTFLELLDKCLSSRNGRYLMLIGNNESEFNYIQQYFSIKYSSVQTRTLMGSTLIGDRLPNSTYTEQYTIRKLMEIINYTEGGVTVFFRGLGHLYDNLYDLFNQNFTFSRKKKYCRIALGSTYHPRCIIHENFYCVVFVTHDDLHKCDPPLLNRFEKHLIDMKSLLTKRQEDVIAELNRWIDQWLPMKSDVRFPCRKHFFVEFDNDYIRNLTIDAFHQLRISDNDHSQINENYLIDVTQFCKNQMIRISSFDFPLFLSLDTNAAQSDERNGLIQLYYDVHTDLSFALFINQKFVQEKMSKLLVYTYTQLYHEIDYNNINNYEELKLNHFTTELELIQKLRTHGQSNSTRLLCIRVDYHQNHQHIPLLKHLLHNEMSSDTEHGVCLIFHLQRHKLNEKNNNEYFDEWTRVMIDDLQRHSIIPQNILMNRSYKNLVDQLNFLNEGVNFEKLIDRCMNKLRYRIPMVNERRDRVIQHLISQTVNDNVEEQSLSQLVKQHLLEITEKIATNPHQTQFADWRQDLFNDEINIGSCYSFNNALRRTVVNFMERCLSFLLYHMEKYLLIDSYMFQIQFKDEFGAKLRRLWIHCWITALEKIDISMLSENDRTIDLILGLHLPCAMIEYDAIRQIRQTIAQNTDDDDGDARNNFTLDKLIKESFYGKFIDEVLDDPKILDQYCRDQLILTRNEANIHNLSISFIEHLLKANASKTSKDLLGYLLLDSKELFDVLRIFEIGIPLIDDEDTVSKDLHQQFIIRQASEDKTLKKNDNLYQLILQESNYYLISPGSSVFPEEIYESKADSFIELCLMNLVESLLSSAVIHRVTDIRQLITRYSVFAQNMIQLNKYEIRNIRRFISVIRLASCISVLFVGDEAMKVFKKVYKNKDCCVAFTACNLIHSFIVDVKDIINQEQTTLDKNIILKTLAKLEIEVLRNCYLENNDQAKEILVLIDRLDEDLWKYSARLFSRIYKDLKLSKIIKKQHVQIEEEKNLVRCHAPLKSNDSMKKIEILMTNTVYIQLILDPKYRIIENKQKSKLIEILARTPKRFKESLEKINQMKNEEKLERISLLAWLKHYLLCYTYTFKDKDNSSDSTVQKISEILEENASAFYSTVKLYIIKQYCHLQNITIHDCYSKHKDTKQDWFHSMITQSYDKISSNARRNVILPTPLFQCNDEFKAIDKEITINIDLDDLKELIGECSKNPNKAYSFLMYFIHYYTRFHMNETPSDEQFVNLFKTACNKELNTCFGQIGYNLIYSLCTNFSETSYFHLKVHMTEEELHQRLLILNIIVVIISFRLLEPSSLLSSLLYDQSLKKPENYNEHFDKLSYLPRVALANDLALIQMIHIRNHFEKLSNPNTNVYRCSSNCSWLFTIENASESDQETRCPLCNNKIHISQNETSDVINKSQVSMNPEEIKVFIAEYMDKHKQKTYLNLENEIPGRLRLSITRHFTNFMMDGIFLFLYDSKYMPKSPVAICDYFQEAVHKDCRLLRKQLCDASQYHIWLYTVINNMISKKFAIRNHLDSSEEILELERLIEEELIIPNIGSVIGTIRDYKVAYTKFVFGEDKKKHLINFINEVVEDDDQYPILQYFNLTNIHSIDIIDNFHHKLQLQANYKETYPSTTFVLERLSEFHNIRHLYPIIRCINYLMEKFDYRIKRAEVTKKTIDSCLKEHPNFEELYKEFLTAWYKITLKEIVEHRPSLSTDFKNLDISMFLLDKSKDPRRTIIVTCLQSLARLQNDMITHVEKEAEKYPRCIIPVRMVQQKHLLKFDTNELRELLVKEIMVINYEYGMSEEIIYNFEELEWMLRNEISCLPKIDTENVQYFNYASELCGENESLITEIRERYKQILFDDLRRKEIQKYLHSCEADSIDEIKGLLEYVLSRLRNAKIEHISNEAFIKDYVKSSMDPQSKLNEEPLSSTKITYIIDLYELLEEYFFDKILRENIQNNLPDDVISNKEKQSTISLFTNTVLRNENISEYFKDSDRWIGMLKRLLVRLLPLKRDDSFQLPLQVYVNRADMWKNDVIDKEAEIQKVKIDDNIRLTHAFIILQGLEGQRNSEQTMLRRDSLSSYTSSEEDEDTTRQGRM